MKIETLIKKINQTEARLVLVTKYSPKSKIAKVRRLLSNLYNQYCQQTDNQRDYYQIANNLEREIKENTNLSCSQWNKKEGESRLYFGKDGYLQIVPGGIKYFTKSYVTKEIESIVDRFNQQFTIVSPAARKRNNDVLHTEYLATAYGWAEATDAISDKAREDFDI